VVFMPALSDTLRAEQERPPWPSPRASRARRRAWGWAAASWASPSGYFYIPQTKGHSLEEVEEHWMKGGRPREL